MNWYIFYTPRGWAAIRSEKKTLFAMVLPTPSPLKTFHPYINETGYYTRFITFPFPWSISSAVISTVT